jgi:hypothetical protein
MKLAFQLGFQLAMYLVAVPLELMVIAALLRGGQYRRYPFIFLYVVADLLTTVFESPFAIAYTIHETPEAKHAYSLVFWINERIMQVLVLLLVIALVYQATTQFRSQRTLLTAIICGTMVVAAISLWYHIQDTRTLQGNFRYMTPWTRDLNFTAAILDMGLWALLIGSHRKDRKLLMVTGGLGIQFTGAAIGQALRDMSPTPIVAIASDFLVLTNLARLYIWWQAFRDDPKAAPSKTLPK